MKIAILILIMFLPLESSLQQVEYKEPTQRVDLKLDALNFEIKQLTRQLNETDL